MVLDFDALYQEAAAQEACWPAWGPEQERFAGARRFDSLVREQLRDALRDYSNLSLRSKFRPNELPLKLADACLQAASFLFAAGGAADAWRPWCGLAGRLKALSGELSYALQLCTIAGVSLPDAALAAIRSAPIRSFREQVVRHIALPDTPPPATPTGLQPPDDDYAKLPVLAQGKDQAGLEQAISRIATFWLREIDSETFDPGGYPVFEPEINAVVAALVADGYRLTFADQRVRSFLQAALG